MAMFIRSYVGLKLQVLIQLWPIMTRTFAIVAILGSGSLLCEFCSIMSSRKFSGMSSSSRLEGPESAPSILTTPRRLS